MNRNKFLLFAMLIGFLGCKNEIDINAAYKDVAIVYGFLDQNEPVQYLRIQKLYQNSAGQSTAEGAKNVDSLYFDSLVVTLTNLNGNLVYPCYRVDSIPKDSGFFSTGKNTFYATSLPKNNAANETYQLNIYYPKKKATFSSLSSLVKDAYIPPRKIVLKTSPENHSFPFKFTSGRNSYLYDLIIRYQYKEMNVSDTNIAVFKNIDYWVSKSIPYAPESDYSINVASTQYINYLESQIPVDASKIRRTIGITYIAYGGSEQFQTMLDLSKPNLSVVQKNPLYSNITNGIGIFTSRNLKSQVMGLDQTTINLLASELPNFIP